MPSASTTPKPYDPTATQPLPEDATKPMELPASVTTPPEQQKRPQEREPGPPQTTNKVAGIAYMANNILRGYAQGRQAAEMHKVAAMKRTVDGQGFAYQATAQNLYGLVQSKINAGADPKTVMQDPEIVQATAARDAAWAGWMKSVGAMQQAQEGGPKKSKKGKPQEGVPNPVVGAMSQDPQEKASAWYQIAAKAGPPDRFKVQDLITNAPRTTADRGTLEAEAANAQDSAKLQQRYNELIHKEMQPAPKVTSKIDMSGSSAEPPPSGTPGVTPGPAGTSGGGGAPQAEGTTPTGAPSSNLSTAEQREMKEAREELERRGLIKPGGGDVHGSPRLGAPVVASQVPDGALGVDGNPLVIDQNNPHEGYRPIYYANGVVRWQPYAVEQQLKTSAGSGGQPILSNYDKLHGALDTQHPAGAGVQKGEVKVVKTRDAQGNEVEGLVPVAPIYSTPHISGVGRTPGYSSSPGAERALEKETGTKAYQGQERRATDRRAAATHTATLAAAAASGAPAVPPGLPAGSHMFPAFQKATQDTFKAIRAQDLTLGGVPGTPDVGLEASTMKALDNPEQVKKIAVALKALDVSAKQALSNHDVADYGYLKEFENSFYNIPAVQSVMGDLNSDSKQYLADYFRAWTNAATIRSLQGAGGRATQSMYAMLSNELPTIGINVNSKEDAHRYLSRLRNDVDTAKSTLPADMQQELTKQKGHTGSHGASGESSGGTQPHAVDSILDDIFGKPKGQ